MRDPPPFPPSPTADSQVLDGTDIPATLDKLRKNDDDDDDDVSDFLESCPRLASLAASMKMKMRRDGGGWRKRKR